MITPATLLGLACAIANKAPVDQATLDSLTENEKTQIEKLIEAGACLPENLEKLIERIKQEDLNKDLKDSRKGHQPCEGCF
jgi:hypothetical protein